MCYRLITNKSGTFGSAFVLSYFFIYFDISAWIELAFIIYFESCSYLLKFSPYGIFVDTKSSTLLFSVSSVVNDFLNLSADVILLGSFDTIMSIKLENFA